ncbi:MAG TPA: glycosyltransferase [Planctomycetota bacterium]|nr:glycosyltransferase [Planctomycetota bacterium]
MKIAFVHQDHCLYGASRSLLAMIEYLVGRGHSCMVLLPRTGPLVAELEAHGIRYAITPWRGWMSPEGFSRPRRLASAAKGLLLNLIYVQRAAKLCRSFAPDIVHTNSSRTAFGSMLASRLGAQHTWHFREFLGGKYTVGGEFSLGRAMSMAWVRSCSSAVVLVSEALKTELAKSLSGKQSYVVHNGVMPLQRMLQVASPVPDSKPFTLALVGRFDRWKQPMVALEAVKLLRDEGKNVRLLMAGTGLKEDTLEVRNYIATHGLSDRVEMLGFVKDMAALYGRSHALLMCSRGDAFGRVIAEAMAHGRPVIGADAGATPELVQDGVNGVLYRSGDTRDLAEKICRLMAQPNLLREMGQNAARIAQQRFSNEKYGEAMERIFLDVLNNRKPRCLFPNRRT